MLDHLREIDARRLHLRRGYSSLFDYAVHELGYIEASAWRRIKAMRLSADTRGVHGWLQDGSLNLSNAAQLQNAFERWDRSGAGRDATGAQGAGTNPAPRGGSAPTETATAAGAPLPVLDARARQQLVERAVGKSTRQVQQMLAEVDSELAQPTERIRALGDGLWELKVVVDGDCQQGLQQLRALLSHVDPHLTMGQLVGRLVREGVKRYDPGRPRRRQRNGHGSASERRVLTAPAPDDVGGDATSAPKRRASEVDRNTSSESSRGMPGAEAPATARRFSPPADCGTSAAKSLGDSEACDGRAATSPAKAVAAPANRGIGGSKPEESCVRGTTTPAKRHAAARPRASALRFIPAAVKQEVWRRDQGCCSYVDPHSGRRCGSRFLLQIDHVVPVTHGGGAEPGNLRLLCAPHHRYRHAQGTAGREVARVRRGSRPRDGNASYPEPCWSIAGQRFCVPAGPVPAVQGSESWTAGRMGERATSPFSI